MSKYILTFLLLLISASSYSGKLDDIQDQLDDMQRRQKLNDFYLEVDRNNQRLQQLQNLNEVQQTQKQVEKTHPLRKSLRSKIQSNPSGYKLIDASGTSKTYIELPITRPNKNTLSFKMIYISDEVLESSGIKFSEVKTSIFYNCTIHNVNYILPIFYNFEGKNVGTGEDLQSEYIKIQTSPLWSKIEKLYCQ